MIELLIIWSLAAALIASGLQIYTLRATIAGENQNRVFKNEYAKVSQVVLVQKVNLTCCCSPNYAGWF